MSYFEAKTINDVLTVFEWKQEAYFYVYIPPPPPDPTPPPPPETFEWMGMCNILDVAEVFNDNKVEASFLFEQKSSLVSNAELQPFNDIVNLSKNSSFLFEPKQSLLRNSKRIISGFSIKGR